MDSNNKNANKSFGDVKIVKREIGGKEVELKLIFEDGRLKTISAFSKTHEFDPPIRFSNYIPVEELFNFLDQFKDKFNDENEFAEFCRFVNDALEEHLPQKIKYEAPGIRIEVIATDGIRVPATNFFVKYKNDFVVGELTYVWTRQEIEIVKKKKRDTIIKHTLEPLLVFRKNNERGCKFLSVYKENPIEIGGRLIYLEQKSQIATSIPTLMKYETVSKFLKGKSIHPREVYDELKEYVKNFVNFEWDDRLYDLICCYIIGTYFYDVFNSFPILVFYGDYESGKTRAMLTVVYASHRGMECLDPTSASVFRSVDALRPTLGIDELTNLDENIQRIVRASYKKGEKVPRVEKVLKDRFILSMFEVYTPLVIATHVKLPDILLSRAIQIIMRKADDPHPEGRDPRPEDAEEIREKLYLTRLTFADKVYEVSVSKEINKQNLLLRGRDYEIWKPILTIAKIIGDEVFERVYSLAREMTEEKREHLHEEERLLLQALGKLFEAEAHENLKDQTQIEFSASSILDILKDMLLLEEYDNDEKRFRKDWNPQKIGIRLTRMGIRKTRKGKKGARTYFLTYDEFIKLCSRYLVNMSDLSGMSAKEGEAPIPSEEPTKIEKTSKISVGISEETNEKVGEADISDMSDKFPGTIVTKSSTQIKAQVDTVSEKNVFINGSKEIEEKIYKIVERAAGEAGIIYVKQKLKEEHGIDLDFGEIRSIARASPKLEVSERTVKVRRSK